MLNLVVLLQFFIKVFNDTPLLFSFSRSSTPKIFIFKEELDLNQQITPVVTTLLNTIQNHFEIILKKASHNTFVSKFRNLW